MFSSDAARKGWAKGLGKGYTIGMPASAPGPEEALPDQDRQRTLLSYALLTGLTPLIPVPFADDLAKGHLRRRLVHRLARAHGRDLSEDTLQALARGEQTSRGCLGGCLIGTLLYPLKKVFRKVFFLEWKRAVDLTSHTYHWGYLLDYALGEGLVGPATAAGDGGSGSPGADDLRRAIERACQEVPLRPLERAVGATLRQSRGVLLSAAHGIGTRLRGAPGRPRSRRCSGSRSRGRTSRWAAWPRFCSGGSPRPYRRRISGSCASDSGRTCRAEPSGNGNLFVIRNTIPGNGVI
jgi:hypothetical protein